MDNDLMARRLRPPSEPIRTQNGQSPAGADQAPWATDSEMRSDVPWDRPAEEPWPPPDEFVAEQTWPPVAAPSVPVAASVESVAAAEDPWAPAQTPEPLASFDDPSPGFEPAPFQASQSFEPDPIAPTPPPIAQAPAGATAGASGPTTWDDMPAPWDQPADWAPAWDDLTIEPIEAVAAAVAADAVEETAAVPPAAPVMDESVPSTAPWDEPEPFTFGDTATEPADLDDRPAEMLRGYEVDDFVEDLLIATADEGEVEQVAAAEPESVAQPELEPQVESATDEVPAAGAVDVERPPWADVAAAADLDDAFAPVLGDVEQPAPPPWSGWTDEASAATAVPPVDAAAALGPTPPDDLFTLPSPEIVDAPGGGQIATAEVSVPALFSTTPLGQPVVVRIEVAIVDGNAVVRPIDGARQVGPIAPSAVLVDHEVDDDSTFTPRHPEFEPRTYLNGNGTTMAQPVPEATPAPAPWLQSIDTEVQPAQPEAVAEMPAASAPAPSVWILPAINADAEDPWAQPVETRATEPAWPAVDPMAAWTMDATEPDPLTALPAASLDANDQQPNAFAAAASFAAAEATAPTLVPPAATPVAAAPAAQSDLWFLSSEPDAMAVDDSQQATSEPSNTLTAGLTVLMAVVVIGLVIAFLWLMTSLPILR